MRVGIAWPSASRKVGTISIDSTSSSHTVPRLCQVTAGGAVLVRPDAHVAWRTIDLPANPLRALKAALAKILCR